MKTLKDILDFIDNPEDFTLLQTEDGREHEIKLIDDYGLSCGSNGQFFLAGAEFGATHLIHASSFGAAWGAWIDESPTIDQDEVFEAYGIDDCKEMAAWKDTHPAPMTMFDHSEWEAWIAGKKAEALRILAQWDADAGQGLRQDYPELIEGYEMQDNSSETGIVDVGYSWMREDDLSLITIARKNKKEG